MPYRLLPPPPPFSLVVLNAQVFDYLQRYETSKKTLNKKNLLISIADPTTPTKDEGEKIVIRKNLSRIQG
jgi:hypothetical protein